MEKKEITAVAVSIRIMEAFIAMKKFLTANANLFQRMETIEHNQLEMQKAPRSGGALGLG